MDGMANKKGASQGCRSVVDERWSSADEQGNASEKRLYEKWLSMLCVGMAIFGIGVMLVGYKAPTVGLVATVVMLVVASALFAMKARWNTQE